LNRKLPFLPIIGLVIGLLPCLIEAQVPPNTVVFKDMIARFRAGAEPVRIVFYSYPPRQQGIGFIVVSRSGKLLGKTEMSDGNSVGPATGVYDTRAEGIPDIILAAGVGAKTYQVSVYSFQNDQLKEIFNWSGWHFEVVRLNGQPVIAVRPTDYGTLPMLYRWKRGQFVQSDQDFPDFFDKAIKTQQDGFSADSQFPVMPFLGRYRLKRISFLRSKLCRDKMTENRRPRRNGTEADLVAIRTFDDELEANLAKSAHA